MGNYVKLARQTAKKYGVPTSLFLSMIDHESGWKPDAISPVGAIGLGQLMPGTAQTLGVNPTDPKENLDGAARHLATMFRKTGTWPNALRAYNMGLAGSQTSKDAGAEYAKSVIAGRKKYAALAPPKQPTLGAQRFSHLKPGGGKDWKALSGLIFENDPTMKGLFDMVIDRYAGPTNPSSKEDLMDRTKLPIKVPNKDYGVAWNGRSMTLPTVWHATHVTDGLDWGTKSAIDIMGDPGTALGAPETGTILYFHPTGAQGGGSMELRTPSGRLYWIGHIADGLPEGTQVTRGQKIAVISPDHPRPHVHIDRRG